MGKGRGKKKKYGRREIYERGKKEGREGDVMKERGRGMEEKKGKGDR